MVKRARLIYNPTSGREEMRRRLPDVLQRMESYGFETSTHATIGEGDAALAAAEAARRGFDLVVAAGGDGTLNEVVSGLAGMDVRPPLGVLPLGTTNDLARALGIPRSWDAAIDLIAEGYVRPIDVGQVNQRYFVNIAGGGSLTELTYEVPSKMKTMLGQLAYYMKGFEKLPRLKPIRMKVTAEEMELDEEMMIFLIANSNSVGGFEKLAPDAQIDDGYMDAFFLRRCTLADFIRLASAVVRGERVQDPLLVQFRTKRIRIESPDYVQLNLDGEFGGTLPCDIQVLPKHIGVFVDPAGKMSYHKSGVGLAFHAGGAPGSGYTPGGGTGGGVVSAYESPGSFGAGATGAAGDAWTVASGAADASGGVASRTAHKAGEAHAAGAASRGADGDAERYREGGKPKPMRTGGGAGGAGVVGYIGRSRSAGLIGNGGVVGGSIPTSGVDSST